MSTVYENIILERKLKLEEKREKLSLYRKDYEKLKSIKLEYASNMWDFKLLVEKIGLRIVSLINEIKSDEKDLKLFEGKLQEE